MRKKYNCAKSRHIDNWEEERDSLHQKRKLYLSTDSFPYGKGEKSFLEVELKTLYKYFDITIISHSSKEALTDIENKTVLDNDIKNVNICIELSMWKKIFYMCTFFLKSKNWTEISEIIKRQKNIIQRIAQSVGYYAYAKENFKQMKQYGLLVENEEVIYYTYWHTYYTYSMIEQKAKYKNFKLLTRTHGYDLYDERCPGGRQPYKRVMDGSIDRIVFICDRAKEYYLSNLMVKDGPKYIVSRIGTRNPVESKVKEKENSFVLVSCSNVIALKRVELIIDALSLIKDCNIIWYHFGNGEEYNNIVKYAKKKLSKNITYCLKGYTLNDEIHRFYSENLVDCFITTSSTEGLPVSIQEAMSYGIPIIATDVGGISEMIEDNGILLSANPTSQEVKDAIVKIIFAKEEEKMLLRKKSYELWCKKYNAKNNSEIFVAYIRELMNK